MPALTSAERDAIAALFAKGDVEGGFERLARSPDLKAVDLPQLDKRALARLGEDADTARAFVAGTVAESASVRRLTRKYAPKLAGHGPDALARLIFECVRPFRKLAKGEKGLAGDHGGYATPFGPSILGAKLSWEVKNPNVAVYSDATRFLKEALENLSAAASSLPDPILFRVHEYLRGLGRHTWRDVGSPIQADLPPELAGKITPGFAVENLAPHPLVDRLRAQDPATLAALDRWSKFELLLGDEAPEGSVEATLRARFLELPEDERHLCAVFVALGATRYSHGLGPEQTAILLGRLEVDRVPEKFRWFFRFPKTDLAPAPTSGSLAPPGAAELLAARTPGASAPAPAKKTKAKAAASTEIPATAAPAAPVVEGTPPLAPHFGGDPETALMSLLEIAKSAGAPVAWQKLVTDTEATWLKEKDAPEPGKEAARVEATIEAARQAILDGKTKSRPERTQALVRLGFRAWEAPEEYLPESVLDGPWADHLAELMAANQGSTIKAALRLLPTRAIAAKAAKWRAAATGIDKLYGDTLQAIEAAVMGRGPGIAPALGPILERAASEWGSPQHSGPWSFSLAVLYDAHGVEGRAAAAKVVAAAKLPEKKFGGKCHLATPAYTWVFRKAWDRRDADFVGAAVSRVAVPLYLKGKKAFVPFEPALKRSDYAVHEGSAPPEKQLPLEEVLAFVARERPKLLEQGVAEAGKIASFEKGARAFIDTAAKLPAAPAGAAGASSLDDTVALLEAADAPVVKSGLDMLLPRAGELADRLDEVMRGLERAVGSTSPGVVQSAAALLGAIGAGHESRRADALALLEECLASTNMPTLEETLRALAKAFGSGKKKKAGGISKAGLKRIKALGEEEPKRLGKLASKLLGG
jgi:hypothetical protein